MQCPYCSQDIKDCDLGEFFDCPSCRSALQLEGQELILIKKADSSISGVSQEALADPSEEVVENPLEEVVTDDIKSSVEDIVQFGNSPSQKNHFSYHLKIEGIFVQDIQKRVEQIVASKVLRLDTVEIFSKINDGKLSISNLNAAKMVYLVRKLSSLPVELHWVQESRL